MASDNDKEKDNDKENEGPSGTPGAYRIPKIKSGGLFVESRGLAGSSGEAWRHQYKPVGVLGAAAAFAETAEGVVLNFDEYSATQSRIGDIEAKLAKIRKQLAEKTTALGEAEKDIEKRKGLEKEQKKLLDLHGVLFQVHPAFETKLTENGDNDLKRWFDKEPIGSEKAFVISIDIRKSTELMLLAREPGLFATFVTELCNGLRGIILDQFGIFDKFTGDGVLAYFPKFYSGKDAGYRAISAASKSHILFEKIYRESRNCFKTVLSTGLGIGIDYGTIFMVKANNSITAVGEPVVYACRMGGAKPGITLLNQPAYEKIEGGFNAYCNIEETNIKTKEGHMVAYSVKLVKEKKDVAAPSWYQVDKSNGETIEKENKDRT